MKKRRYYARKRQLRGRKGRKKIWALSACAGAIFVTILILTVAWYVREEEKEEMSPPDRLVIETVQTPIHLEKIHSHSGILLRLEDGKVMAKFQENERIFPASLTKLMTCIVAIENTEDFEEKLTVDVEAYNELYSQSVSMAGFLPGEEARVIDMLYGMILPSGGECSVAVAEHIAGSQEKFVEMMNEKARQLGMDQTHFVNETGLHDEDHYSTVKDISTLLEYALKNEMFKEIFCRREYSVPSTNQHLGGFSFQSSVFKLQEDWTFDGGEIMGGKTGFTDQAGLCLATMAQVRNEEYIAVTAGAQGDHGTEPYHVYDAFYLYSQVRGDELPRIQYGKANL